MQLMPMLDPLVVVYEKRKVAIRRVADYAVRPDCLKYDMTCDLPRVQVTLTNIKRSLRALAQVPASDITLQCNTLPHQDGEYVDISEDIWPDIAFRSYLKTVVVDAYHPAGTIRAPFSVG